ncbi:unnamed protein product [marine sediment metagenome]|uniref:Lipoprotein n=1 Tax=marine sediment metagenome TaxID=412755 RepID=X0TG18_9ZZZZ
MKKLIVITALLAFAGCGGRSGVPTAPRNVPPDTGHPCAVDKPLNGYKFTDCGAVWVP